MFVVVVAIVALCAGCPQSNLDSCDDLVCPANSVCVAGGCASQEEASVCEGKPDREGCATSEFRGACVSGACRPLNCGDGVLVGAEACDDGNNLSGDGCSANCASTEKCGNSILDPGEVCDDGNLVDGDGCQRSCKLPSCGDMITDTAYGEMCDDGNATDGDGCSANCRSNERCGNGVIDTIGDNAEQCDNGAQNSNAPNAICRACTR